MATTEATAGYPGGADKARQPGGTPVGGRFATMTRQEPDVTLANLSDEDYNRDGTFEYPPVPRSVAQHVSFWLTVPVPEAILTRVRNGYVARWEAWADEQMAAWAVTNPEPLGRDLRPKVREHPAWVERCDAQYATLDDVRPNSLPAVLTRPLVRAAQMAAYANMLNSQEEYDRVLDTTVDLGDEEPATVRSTLDYWHLDELPDAVFEDPGNYTGLNAALTTQALHELVGLIRDQQTED